MNPGLQVAGTGLQHHAGVVSLGAHGGDHRRLCSIQVEENVACVLVTGVGLQIDAASLAVAAAQKADGGRTPQLVDRPQPLAGERPPGLLVNQADQVQLVGHRRELPANGLHGDEESVVVHDRHSAIATNRRTMDFRQTANRLLTVCLSPGGRRKEKRTHIEPGQCVMV